MGANSSLSPVIKEGTKSHNFSNLLRSQGVPSTGQIHAGQQYSNNAQHSNKVNAGIASQRYKHIGDKMDAANSIRETYVKQSSSASIREMIQGVPTITEYHPITGSDHSKKVL